MTTRGTSLTANGVTLYGRTMGTANFETTERFDVATALRAVRKKTTLARDEYFQVQAIPQKVNELVRWRKMGNATGAIYQIKDGGVQHSTASLGYNLATEAVISHTADALVPSIVLDGDYVQASPNKYGIVYRGTVGQLSATLDDPREEAIEQIGYGVARFRDYKVRSLFQTNATTITPDADLTTIDDTGWANTHVMSLQWLNNVRAYLDEQGLEPHDGGENFTIWMGHASMVGLMNDTRVTNFLQYSGPRDAPITAAAARNYIQQIAGFNLEVSNAIARTFDLNQAGTVLTNGGRECFVMVKDAAGSVSMSDPRVGTAPSASRDSGDPFERVRAEGPFPNPIKIIRKDPGQNGVDDFDEQWSVAAKFTSIHKTLYPARLIRLVHHVGTVAGDIGVIASAVSESDVRTAATGAV
jgi:hypothetical protein